MRPLIVIVAVLAFSIPAGAHRLDEYLQAARIAVDMHRIDLNIDLTPGEAVAPELLPLIDPDANAHVPSRQGEHYAQRVLQDLSLELDGKRQVLKLDRVSFPPRADMQSGEGTIHLHAVAKISTLKPGPHEIHFLNTHLPKLSVYLVNALVPQKKAIQITGQTRDDLQKDYRLTFEVNP